MGRGAVCRWSGGRAQIGLDAPVDADHEPLVVVGQVGVVEQGALVVVLGRDAEPVRVVVAEADAEDFLERADRVLRVGAPVFPVVDCLDVDLESIC